MQRKVNALSREKIRKWVYKIGGLCYNRRDRFRRMQEKGGSTLPIIRMKPGDVLELKKKHPCGSTRFRVLRAGSEVRVLCLGCGRDMTVDRLRLEKAGRRVETSPDTPESNG